MYLSSLHLNLVLPPHLYCYTCLLQDKEVKMQPHFQLEALFSKDFLCQGIHHEKDNGSH